MRRRRRALWLPRLRRRAHGRAENGRVCGFLGCGCCGASWARRRCRTCPRSPQMARPGARRAARRRDRRRRARRRLGVGELLVEFAEGCDALRAWTRPQEPPPVCASRLCFHIAHCRPKNPPLLRLGVDRASARSIGGPAVLFINWIDRLLFHLLEKSPSRVARAASAGVDIDGLRRATTASDPAAGRSLATSSSDAAAIKKPSAGAASEPERRPSARAGARRIGTHGPAPAASSTHALP